jgi:RNA polymerase sigma-70 factor (ECF subfamily)
MSVVKPFSRSSAESPSDAAIMARVADGDAAALGVLYDRYAVSLLRFARRLDRHDAEDIVQKVFMRVLRLAPKFDPNATSARPWLFAITTRIVQEHRRSLRRWTAVLARLASHPARPPATMPDPRSDLQLGLAQLSAAKRSVLLLAEVEGFACEEIASMLEIPVGTVWTRLHHARRELRRFHERGKS